MGKLEKYFNKGIGHISSCMTPIIPVIVAGGLMKIIVIILGFTPLFGIFPDTKTILEAISNAPFYFLPILVAYSSAKHFQTQVVSALTVTSFFLLPEFISLMEKTGQVSFVGIPVYQMSYSYTVFPIIGLIYFMSVWERQLKKWLKGIWSEIFLQLLLILVSALVGIIIIGPIVGVISQGVVWLISWLQINAPVLAWVIFDASVSLQIVTGINWIFVSLAITNIGEFGVESGFMVGFFILSMSLTAITFVAQLKTKDKKKRSEYISSLVTVFFTGTTEPAVFGIYLSNKTAMLSTIIAGAVAGLYHGIVTIHTYVYAFPTLFSLPMFYSDKEPSNMVKALIAGIISFIVAFVIMFFKYDEKDTIEMDE